MCLLRVGKEAMMTSTVVGGRRNDGGGGREGRRGEREEEGLWWALIPTKKGEEAHFPEEEFEGVEQRGN